LILLLVNLALLAAFIGKCKHSWPDGN